MIQALPLAPLLDLFADVDACADEDYYFDAAHRIKLFCVVMCEMYESSGSGERWPLWFGVDLSVRRMSHSLMTSVKMLSMRDCFVNIDCCRNYRHGAKIRHFIKNHKPSGESRAYFGCWKPCGSPRQDTHQSPWNHFPIGREMPDSKFNYVAQPSEPRSFRQLISGSCLAPESVSAQSQKSMKI